MRINDKAKPVERRGRKATGPRFLREAKDDSPKDPKTAELPLAAPNPVWNGRTMATLNYSICGAKTLTLLKMLAPVLVLLVSGCVPGLLRPPMSVPGETLANSSLQYDTWKIMEIIDEGEAANCSDRHVVDTRILEHPSGASVRGGPLLEGGWVEEWALDRCGERVVYRVKYTADGRGGTYFNVSDVPKDD